MPLTPPTFKGHSGAPPLTPRLTPMSSLSSCLSQLQKEWGIASLFRCPIVYYDYYGNNRWVDFHSLMFCHDEEIKSSYEYDLISSRNDIFEMKEGLRPSTLSLQTEEMKQDSGRLQRDQPSWS